MLAFATLALAAFTAFSSVTARAIPVPRSVKPATYDEPYLEPYKTYHTRYLALSCQTKHKTQFFTDCCHPMLSTETLANDRKAYCKPSAPAASSASAAEPTSTVVANGDDDDDDNCDDGDDEPVSTKATSKATSTKAASTKAAAPTTIKIAAPVTTSDKPASTTTPKAEPSKTTTSKASGSTGSSGGDSAVHSGGIATFFTQNGVAGACGTVHKDTDLVAALTSTFYGSFGKKSSNCGRQIQVTRVSDGRQVIVTAADGCPTCESANSLDLSVAAFKKIATENEGVADITWKFIS